MPRGPALVLETLGRGYFYTQRGKTMAELERDILASNLVTLPLLDQASSIEGHWHYSDGYGGGLSGDGLTMLGGMGGYGDVNLVAATLLSISYGDEYDTGTELTVIANLESVLHSNENIKDTGQVAIAVAEVEEGDLPSMNNGVPGGAAYATANLTGGFQQVEMTLTLDEVEGASPLYLMVYPFSSSNGYPQSVTLKTVRADFSGPDDYGLFTGDTADTEEIEHVWANEPNGSRSYALAPAVEEPDDGGDGDGPAQGEFSDVVLNMAARVLKLSNVRHTPAKARLAAEHVTIVMAYVHGYTRGRGFTQDNIQPLIPEHPLEQVIVSSAARLTNNPRQVTYYVAGDYTERPAVLAGWTLPELAILNNYRKRWA